MSNERINLLIGAGQLLLGFLLWLGLDVAGLKKNSPMIHTSTLIVFLLIGGLAFSAFGFYRTFKPPSITPKNIEPHIRQWLDAFGLGTRRLHEPNLFFAYEVTLQTGIPIAIIRTRQHSHYVTLVSKIGFGPEHKATFDKLPELEKKQFIRRLRLEAAKAKTAYSFDASFETLIIEKRLPITDNFSEADLLDGLGEINFSAIIVLDTVASELEVGIKQPSSTPDKGASPP